MSKKTLDPKLQAVVTGLQNKVTSDPQVKNYIAQTSALTSANPGAAKDIMAQRSRDLTALVKSKGYLPQDGQYTLDPSNGNMIRHGGWAGLSKKQKAIIIAAAAATGVGAGAALAAGGGAAAAGAGGAGASGLGGGIGVTSGLGGLGTIGTTVAAPTVAGAGLGAGSAAATGLGTKMATGAIKGGAQGALTGGGWKGALMSAGLGAATGGMGGAGGAAAGGGTKAMLANAAKAGLSKYMTPGTVGSVAGGLAAGAEKGRGQENLANQNTANFLQNESQQREAALMNRGGLDLQQRKFSQDSESNAYKKAMQSALGMNMKDVTLQRPEGIPMFEYQGGARPSAFGAEGKAASEQMNKLAMQKLMSGEKFDTLPAYAGTNAPEFKKPGFWENALGTAGMVGNAMEGVNAQGKQDAYQAKIMAALEAMSQQRTPGLQEPGATPGVPPPQPRRPLEPLPPNM